MNKSGFTLIEVLVVVALLAAISVTVGVNLSGMQERQKQKRINEYEETLEKAACVYAETNNITSNSKVTVETLLNAGLVKKDLVDPSTNDNIENNKSLEIEIKWENNERKCLLKTS